MTMRSYFWYGLAGIIVLSDQVTKFAIVHNLAYGEQINLTANFALVHVRNEGAAFSLLADAGGWQRYFFIALALAVSLWLIHMLRQGLTRIEAAGYGLILGGALGNVADRITRGSVVDYLDFHVQAAHWPAFNFADVSIFLGVLCLIRVAIATKKRSEKL